MFPNHEFMIIGPVEIYLNIRTLTATETMLSHTKLQKKKIYIYILYIVSITGLYVTLMINLKVI